MRVTRGWYNVRDLLIKHVLATVVSKDYAKHTDHTDHAKHADTGRNVTGKTLNIWQCSAIHPKRFAMRMHTHTLANKNALPYSFSRVEGVLARYFFKIV